MVGTEAFSNSLLERLGKAHQVRHIFNFYKVAKSIGIETMAELRTDYGEEAGEVEEQIDVINQMANENLLPERIYTGPINYWKGIELYDEQWPELELRITNSSMMPIYRRKDTGRNKIAWGMIFNRIKDLGIQLG